MGCVNSKHVVRYFKNLDYNDGPVIKKLENDGNRRDDGGCSGFDPGDLKVERFKEAEHVAAGWPSWLSAVAGEAIDGWLPLKSNCFERLEKIGQGSYSSVYKARHVKTGRYYALKKVRFHNLKPDSVKFMAREITILRTLDHPNIMKLEGLITSTLSCNIYFVFDYMEHDLAGLLSCPDIKFTDSQIKCYMKQLLSGIEYCHSLGVLHRDIKTANILVNNEGTLKIGDFGLAKFHGPECRESLTSHVVTLWYRPPELLLGCTKYGTGVDLWSVGCVFAELCFGKPILKGRTEVEQLHKILTLCGTPPDEYWNKSKLPLATMFKPHHAYESSLRETCKQLPETAVDLIHTLLSLDPCKRGTATSALKAEYFHTKPYACDPASLPKYLPNKEQTSFGKAGVTDAPNSGRRNNGDGSCLKVSQGSKFEGACALPTQATASNGGFVWARRRKCGGNLIVSDGVGAVRAAVQQMPDNGESTSVVCGGFRNCRVKSVNQSGSFDSSKVHNSQDLLNVSSP
ncbi:cyclin-dependent kinase C-2 C-like isoform X1 [Bidens hawaiensis]|uniref:cyclin-dependent kinase C-2 C-like isoform X1 n=1 Tax=Bidens hawaiensis TaxID=980011 RepID=UPI00404A603A